MTSVRQGADRAREALSSQSALSTATAQRGGVARAGAATGAGGVIGKVAVRWDGVCVGVGMSRIVGAGGGAPTRNEVCRTAPGRTLRSAARAAAAEG